MPWKRTYLKSVTAFTSRRSSRYDSRIASTARPEPNICSQKCGKGSPLTLASTVSVSTADEGAVAVAVVCASAAPGIQNETARMASAKSRPKFLMNGSPGSELDVRAHGHLVCVRSLSSYVNSIAGDASQGSRHIKNH